MPDVATIEDRVASCIDSYRLLEGVGRLGLAVSGGSDSIALLHIMAPICAAKGILLFVLNMDHGVEGEHSDEDAVFVKGVADSLGVQFVGGVASGIHGGGGESFEMAARKVRHAFFRDKFTELALDAIATGHQADDVAETFLLRLVRGAGADGLSGLKPVSEGPTGDIRIIRPLLGIGREELREWLRGRGHGWREDPSNADTSIQRNGIRRVIIPELERLVGHDVIGSIAQSAEILREEDMYLEGVANEVLSSLRDGDALPISTLHLLQPLPIRRRVVRAWLLDRFGADAAGFRWVEAVLAMRNGMSITLPGDARIKMEFGFAKPDIEEEIAVGAPPDMEVHVANQLIWGRYSIFSRYALKIDRSAQAFGKWPATCSIAFNRLQGKPLVVRERRPGDRIAPIGMEGTKSLQDILVDAKVPAIERDAYPVFECDGQIVWLPGYRVSRDFAVRDGDVILALSVTCD